MASKRMLQEGMSKINQHIGFMSVLGCRATSSPEFEIHNFALIMW